MDTLGLLEVAARPVRKGQQEAGPAAPDVIVFRQEVQRASGLVCSAGNIADSLGAERSGEGDRPRERPELLLVSNQHSRRQRAFASRVHSSVEPSFGVVQAGVRQRHFAESQDRKRIVGAQHWPDPNHVVR